MFLDRMPSANAQKAFRSNSAISGFGLPELLIVSAIGSLLAIVLAQIYSGFVRERARLEMYQKAVNNWERISRMIETDVSESRLVVLPGAGTCGGVKPSFDLWLNRLGNASATTYAVISYSLDNGSLYRCGPPVCSNFSNCKNQDGTSPSAVDGRLDLSAGSSTTALVAVNVAFLGGTPSLTTGGSLDYGLTFTGIDGSKIASFTSRSRPRAKWVEQCNFATLSSC